jgi:filamentous hemagglutinin
MNKNLYRIIFNQRRGQMMAVSETATVSGKAASGEGTGPGVGVLGHLVAKLRPLCLSVLASLGMMMLAAGTVSAQVIADPSAPGNQRPTVLQTTNGLPQINIQTPSAAGVSRNTYRQFDIQSNGAILNNARTNTQTQLGGWVQGNPWLATGSARIILNEVNSTNPSQLRGYIEVAGQRAEVIIANPAGVNADGAGFINANRVTITTGTPQISGGNLDGYLVQLGTVTINGKGLDATLTDYTGILARAVQINAGIWAKDLKIVTGANQINAEHTTHAPSAGTGAVPTFALDVAQLGGMYAGKITLIGTESGVGVRNAGVIGASAGDVVLQSDGWLTNSGSVQALGNASNTRISAVGDIASTGTIYATGNTSIKGRGNISISGLVAAQNHATVVANGATSRVDASSSAVLASGLNSNGTLGTAGDLQVQGSTGVAIQGKTASAGNTHIAGSLVDLHNANVSGDGITLTATNGDLNATGAAITAQGTLTAQTPQTLRTDHAQVSASQINLSAHDLSNVGGQITQSRVSDLTIQLPGNLNNSQGHIATNSQNLTLGATVLTNTDGKIEHAGAGALNIGASTFDGQRGLITSNGALTLNATNVNTDSATTTAHQVTLNSTTLSNRSGHISQTGAGQTTVVANQHLDNTAGKIETNGNATISATTLVNNQGRIASAQDANISASSSLNNTDGVIISVQNLALTGGDVNNTRGAIQAVGGNATINVADLSNNAGNVYAGSHLATSAVNVTNSGNLYAAGKQILNVTGAVNNTGLIAAQGDNVITANSLTSGATSLLGAGIKADGTLANAGNLSVTTIQGLTANGQNLAAGNAALTGAWVNLSGSQTSAANIAITANTNDVITDNATISTAGTLSVVALTQDTQSWTNVRGTVSANQLDVQVANLNNTQGELVQTGTGDTTINLTSPTGTLDNTSARIAVNSNNLTLGAHTLTNTDGKIEHAGVGVLAIHTENLNDQRGRITGNGALTIDADNIDHRNATAVADQIAITASHLDNHSGQLVTRGHAANGLTLNLDTLNNQQGVIDAAGVLDVIASGAIDNTQGAMQAGAQAPAGQGTLTLQSAALTNAAGKLIARDALTVTTGALVNDAANGYRGTIASNLGSTSVEAGATSNVGGLITSATGTSLRTQALDNRAGEISSGARLEIDTQSQALTNTGGQLLANGDMTLRSGAIASNDNARIASGGNLDIQANGLNNDEARIAASNVSIALGNAVLSNNGGSIQADATLIIASGTLNNQSGALLANDSVSVNSAGLNNTDGVISSTNTLDVRSNAQVLSTRGQITSDGDVTLVATALDLTDGVLSAKQAAGVQLGSGLLTNTRGQLIGAQSLTVQSGEIQNVGGRIATGSALNLDTQGRTLNNSAGQIVSGGALNLSSAQLNNTGGTVASLNGNLTANTNGQALINDSGKLQAKLDTTLITGTTSNQSAGLISGRDIRLTSGAFNNQSGEVVAAGDLTAATLALNNDRGLLRAVGGIAVNTNGNGLTNTNSGSNGGVIAGTTFTLHAGSFDNRAGYLGSNGDKTLSLSGRLDNSGGQMLSNADTTISAADLFNVSGRIHALGDIDATLINQLDNRSGQINADSTANLRASTIDNSAGQIDATNLTINASTLRNIGGNVIAGNDVGINANLDNSSGLVSAKRDLTLTAPTLNNAGGRLVGDNSLTVTTSSGSFGGILASANAVTLTVNGDYTNTGLLSAQKRLSVTANNINNSGILTAGQTLGLTTGNLTNSGEISAPTTFINASGTLINTGLIDGNDTTVRAGVLNNTGRIYGDWLSIGGGTLNNSGSGTFAARQDLQIGAYALNNTNGALIYSLGDIAIGGALDANGTAQGSMTSLLNASSRIEARANLTINADNILNRNDDLRTELVTESTTRAIEVQPKRWAERYPLDRFIGIYGGQDNNHFIVHPDLYGQRTTLTPVYTFTLINCHRGGCQGGDPVINYDWDAPEFTLLGVTSPGAPPVEPGRCTFSSSAECRAWRIEKSAWNAQLDLALDELAVAIDTYNVEVKADNATVKFEDYRIYDITATQSRSEIVSTRPAELLAGGRIYIDGALTNQDSHVVAGGALIAIGAGIQSLATEGEQRTLFSGTTQSSELVSCGTLGDRHCREWSGITAFNPAPLVETFSLASVRVEQYTANPTGSRDLSTATASTDTSRAATTIGATSNGRSAGEASLQASLVGPVDAQAASVGGVGTGTAQRDTVGANIGSIGSLSAGVLPTSSNRQAPAVVQVLPVDNDGAPAVVLTSAPALSLPTASLFVLHGEPGARFVVETDPRFTDRRQFLSSDHYLQQLQLDPAFQQKRLGDGFYEQQLINDQVLTLTGRRYLTDYSNAEEQYRALMNAGVAFLKQYQLTPGVALTAEQMALLTTDMVVLTVQAVRLPDGRSEQVLVPQLYLRRTQAGDLTRSSALIAGSDVYLNSTSDLINSGAIAADRSLVLHADKDLINSGGRFSAQDIYARAENDLNNLSGVIQGVDTTSSVNLQAGRDLVLQTRTIQTSNAEGNSSRVNVDRVAIVQGGNVKLEAARDLVVAGAKVNATENLSAVADGALQLSAVAAQYQIDVKDANGMSTKGRSGYVTEGFTTHQLGSLQAGADLTLVAQRNVEIKGGLLAAGKDVVIQGANINVEAAKDNSFHDSQFIGEKSYSRTARADESLVGGIVAAGSNLSLFAMGTPGNAADPATADQPDGNINLSAVNLSAVEGQLTLAAKNDVRIQHLSIANSSLRESYSQSGNAVKTTTSVGYDSVTSTTAIGSSLDGKNVVIQSGNDVTIQGSAINADQALIADAKRDVNIIAAEDTHGETHFSQTRREATGLAKGLATMIAVVDPIAALTPNSINQVAIAALLTQKNQATDQDNVSTTAVGSALTGRTIDIQSKRDTLVEGGVIVADGDVNVVAGRDIAITTAQNTQAGQATMAEQSSGLLRFEVTGNTVGKREQDQAQQNEAVVHTASQIASLGQGGESGSTGSVNLIAEGNNTLTGSSIVAPRGDITIAGSTVLINEVHNSASQASQTHFRETAATAQLKSGYVEAAKGAYEAVQTARDAKDDTGSDRMAALATINAAVSVYNAYQGIKNSAIATSQNPLPYGAGAASQSAAPVSAISVSSSTGVSKGESDSKSSQHTAQGSQLVAGGELNITANGDTATGAGNLTMIGAKVIADAAANLQATGDIDLLAAQSTTEVKSSNSSSNASLGVTFALGGTQNGFSFQIGAQGMRGFTNGEEITHSNTQIRVGSADRPGNLTIASGGDTTLRGASANADQITTDIGGNLVIESLKDKITYDSQQTSVGGGVSLCIPPICYGQMVAVNVNAAESKIKADHDSVGAEDEAAQRGQSRLKAGNGGFDVKVAGNTTLIGGAMTSTASIEKNRLTTGTLTFSDIANHSEAQASSDAVSLSYGSGSGTYEMVKGVAESLASHANGSESQDGLTRATISPATIVITDQAAQTQDIALLNRDGANTHQTTEAIDRQKLQNEVEVRREIQSMTVKSVEFFTDEAHRVMFKTTPQYYKVTCEAEPCAYDPNAGGDPNKNIKVEAIELDEMQQLAQAIKNGDMAQGKVVLVVNGILNGEEGKTDRAGQLAIQNTPAIDDKDKTDKFGETKPTVFLLHYPEANNFISELMVAGYEKFLADKLAYTNYDTSYADTTRELAPYGLSGEGHSRGTLVQENAFNILHDQGWQAPTDMSERMRGAAIGKDESKNSLSSVGMDPGNQLNYLSHPNDPINVIVAGEKGDTGAAWKEWWRVFTSSNSAHSCYGTGAAGCAKIEAPFSYESLGKTPAELNAIREQRRQNP